MPRFSARNIAPRNNSKGVLGVFGVVGLFLLTGALIGGTYFLISQAMASYYQGKISYVAEQIAWREASRRSWNQLELDRDSPGDAQTEASLLLTKMGLPAATSANTSFDAASQLYSVSLAVDGLSLPKNNKLPGSIGMAATRAVTTAGDQPPAVLVLYSMKNPTKNVFIPCYGWYVEGLTDKTLAIAEDYDDERDWGNQEYTMEIQVPGTVTFQEDGVNIPQ